MAIGLFNSVVAQTNGLNAFDTPDRLAGWKLVLGAGASGRIGMFLKGL